MKTVDLHSFALLSHTGQESFNRLYANITLHGSQTNRLVITSCHAGEGKTFTAINLLRTMAANGKRAVLVDADLRGSALSVYMQKQTGILEMPGLAHYLTSFSELSDVLYQTDIDHACIIPAGRQFAAPFPLLSSGKIAEMLAELAKVFDFVLIDTPPMGMAIDAAEIAKSCNGALLVVGCDTTRRSELVEAIQQIERTGCPMLGTVLNGADGQKHRGNKS